jgi:hypothetical protein
MFDDARTIIITRVCQQYRQFESSKKNVCLEPSISVYHRNFAVNARLGFIIRCATGKHQFTPRTTFLTRYVDYNNGIKNVMS